MGKRIAFNPFPANLSTRLLRNHSSESSYCQQQIVWVTLFHPFKREKSRKTEGKLDEKFCQSKRQVEPGVTLAS